MVKNIVFDIAGVIAHWDPMPWFRERFGAKKGEEVFAAAMGSDYWAANIDLGYIPEEELFRHQRESYPHLRAELEEVERDWKEILTPIPETEDLIRRLKAAGYSVYFLSNFPERTFQHVWETTPAFRLVDGGVVSWKVHMMKPHADIYRHILEKYGLAAEETVFTDDTPVNVEGAKAVGLFAWHFTGAAGFENYLKEELGLRF